MRTTTLFLGSAAAASALAYLALPHENELRKLPPLAEVHAAELDRSAELTFKRSFRTHSIEALELEHARLEAEYAGLTGPAFESRFEYGPYVERQLVDGMPPAVPSDDPFVMQAFRRGPGDTCLHVVLEPELYPGARKLRQHLRWVRELLVEKAAFAHFADQLARR